LDQINWDDLRYFLAVARAGRLSAGAQALKCNQSTVARRIDRLEETLNTRLLFRSTGGVSLTSPGMLLLEHAERVESQLLGAAESFDGDAQHPSGIVRVATPEAFGSFLVARNIHLLHESSPDVQLELIPSAQPISLSKREADLMVSLHRPQQGRLKVRRLADYRLSLYASRDYVARYGMPTSPDELQKHKFVWYIDDLLQANEFRYLRQIVADAQIAFSSSSIVAQHEAVTSGVGIGLMHRFMAATDDRLIPLLPDVTIDRTYWVMYRTDQQGVSRIRAVLSFLDRVMQLNRASLLGEVAA
jgi:DNA-binding transcriptional LysR family regulator